MDKFRMELMDYISYTYQQVIAFAKYNEFTLQEAEDNILNCKVINCLDENGKIRVVFIKRGDYWKLVEK